MYALLCYSSSTAVILNVGLQLQDKPIEKSKSEGIFIVEGEERLLIEDNQIRDNADGIVLLDS